MLFELVTGGDLSSILGDPVSEMATKFYIASVAMIIAHLHSKFIANRDLKPENLLLDKDGYLKMVDLGFAKVMRGPSWTLCGTPDYISPEMLNHKGHTVTVDWWCVGILTYECLYGTTPFADADPMNTCDHHGFRTH